MTNCRPLENMKLEDLLTDKNVTFEKKVPALVHAWIRLLQLLRTSQTKSFEKLIEWAQRHTLNLVLHGDWKSQPEDLKDKLYAVVEEFDRALLSYDKLSVRRCKKLREVIKNPWGNPTLYKILNQPDQCTSEDELIFFASENGYLAAMRLQKLCDSHCEDLALRFAKACLRCLRLPQSQDFIDVTTDDQKKYILDIYVSLLHKYKRTTEIISELKHLTLEDGLHLIHRFTNKRVELSRVWKNCLKIAELAAQFFIAAAMMKPVVETGIILERLIVSWVTLNEKLEGIEALPNIIRRIIQTADSAAHIYICCEVLKKEFRDRLKSFTIELYIRALTTDMNELEKQKSQADVDKVQETSIRLSTGFLSLADLLQDNLGVSRECVLTSFSVHPTQSCMDRIEKLAKACGKITDTLVSETDPVLINNTNELSKRTTSNCTLTTQIINAPEIRELFLASGQSVYEEEKPNRKRSFDALISIKGGAVTGSKDYDVLSAPNQVLDAESLGLSKQLCDDLAVVLSSPRYQMLSWVLDWPELKNACDCYLRDVQGSHHTVKELKYLNIDYNQYKNWPSAVTERTYSGIEKGYEQWADEDDSNTSDYTMYDRDHAGFIDVKALPKRGRPRRKPPRNVSSESDYESSERKTADSQSSDLDTASQDADSLGSDGLHLVSKHTTNPSPNSNVTFCVLKKEHTDAIPHPILQPTNIFSTLLAKLQEPLHTTVISKPSFQNPSMVQPFVAEKFPSDPAILKSLRMYRNTKKRGEVLNIQKVEEKINETELPKPTAVSMNPRVLLDRHDFNLLKYENKSFYSGFSNGQSNGLPNGIPKDLSKLASQGSEGDEVGGGEKKVTKYSHMLSQVNTNPCVLLDRYEDLQNLYKNKLLTKKRRKMDVL